MPKLAFILPAIGKKSGKKYIKTWQLMEPLTISTLKAITPGHWETEFFDDRIELIDYETDADLIAVTTEVYTALRAYDIAERFRKAGKTVVLGGYHATLNPGEASAHADAVIIGNAETVWEELLSNFEIGELKKQYTGDCRFSGRIPDRSVFGGKKYSAVGIVETGRGCNFSCEFCAISSFHRSRYYPKPIPEIVKEIEAAKAAGKSIFFFADDNIVADQDHAVELFKAITPLKIRWTGQGSLTMARNPELLHWMKKSGCTVILIGYESLEEKNLQQMNKDWNSRLGEITGLTEKVHRAGLNIYATFVFGFDHDTPELFRQTREFAEKMGFYFAAFNHLLPMPGTMLHERLIREKRMDDPQWWLKHGSLYGELTFTPGNLTAEETAELCKKTRKQFYRLSSVFQRSFKALKRSRSLLLFFYFWYLNLQLGEEVDGKMHLPLGENLDEWPK